MSFVIRDLQSSDYPFLFNSWMKSYSKEFLDKKNVPSQIYYQGLHKLIESLLPSCVVKMAVTEDDLDVIIGYVVASSDENVGVVHYVYVKESFRRLGIASQLLASVGIEPDMDSIFTAYTSSGSELAAKFNSLYHPFYIANMFGDLLDNSR